MQVGFAFLGDEAFEGGFSVDEGGDDVAVAGFAFFEDDRVAVADMGVDHGFAADFESEGFIFSSAAERGDVDGDAAFGFGWGAVTEAGGDAPVDRDIADFFAIEFFRENDGAGFAGDALDDTFFFQGTEVAHRGGLAGEAEVVLDFPGAWHQAGGAAGGAEVFENIFLARGE